MKTIRVIYNIVVIFQLVYGDQAHNIILK